MIVKKTNQPTHRVYAVRKTGQNTGYWVEIGAAWANKDGKGISIKLNLLPVGEAGVEYPGGTFAPNRRAAGFQSPER